ncbi:hypothetical protein FQU96_33365 [Reyranella sp. CPCC 100927]|nr:hypothetical protein FQU96_33365 [Reyranella sp. CPCC 100927]
MPHGSPAQGKMRSTLRVAPFPIRRWKSRFRSGAERRTGSRIGISSRGQSQVALERPYFFFFAAFFFAGAFLAAFFLAAMIISLVSRGIATAGSRVDACHSTPLRL